ncbi:MAG TPA: transposase [Nannocystaceae bacterium]|nr:transposase [Nannocystaceae bacterium]
MRVFREARERCGLALIHYTVLSNHLHLMLEIDREASLELLMRSLATSLARRLNVCFERRGRIFAGRYHAHTLATPSEARNALAYVLLNHRKHAFEHGEVLPAEWIDPRSTGVVFDGWDRAIDSRFASYDFGTSRPSTWLLCKGWRRHGPIALDEIPGDEHPRRPKKKERRNQDRAR